MMRTLILGTRGSDLALAQARIATRLLREKHPDLEVRIEVIKTTGDQRLDVSLSAPGPLEKGLFTKELEEALTAGTIDAAVHSLKDLPTSQPDGLCIGAVLERADPSDLLVSKHPEALAGLPAQAVVATSSPRRQAQILILRPDLTVSAIRGNVPTRLRKLAEDPGLDALILAAAGLDRLGWHILPEGLHATPIPEMLPAPGQGAVALECRAADTRTRAILAAIHHEPTAACVEAEREFLRSLGGGCSLPVGALATFVDGKITLKVFQPGMNGNETQSSS